MSDLKKLAQGRKAFAKPLEKTPAKSKKTLDESCREEVGEAEQAFRKRIEKEEKRRKIATDTEFWFAVYFPTREAKESFLKSYGLFKAGDKYLDGRQVDRILKARSDRRVRSGHIRR